MCATYGRSLRPYMEIILKIPDVISICPHIGMLICPYMEISASISYCPFNAHMEICELSDVSDVSSIFGVCDVSDVSSILGICDVSDGSNFAHIWRSY